MMIYRAGLAATCAALLTACASAPTPVATAKAVPVERVHQPSFLEDRP